MTGLLLKMLSKLTGAYNKNPDSMIGRLFHIFAMALWGVQDTLQVISLWRDIDNAKGVTLDRTGRNFGVARSGASDPFYRLMIKTKVTALLSGGDVDTVISAASALFNLPPERVEVNELFPAKVQVVLNESDLDPEYSKNTQVTAPIITRIIAAGVGKEVLFRAWSGTDAHVYTGIARLQVVSIMIPAE